MTRRPRLLATLLALAAASGPAPVRAAGDAPPAWLHAAARAPVAVATDGQDAVVLLDEATVTIGTNGRRVTRARQVVRILRREGRSRAVARVAYAARSDKLGGLQAWLLPAGGPVRAFGKKEIIEVAAAPEELYSDERVALIDACAEADGGGVFGWEGTVDELSLIGQGVWRFQDTAPVALSRLVVRVPKGWSVDGVLRGRDPVAPVTTADSFTWELRDLPPFVEERYGPEPTWSAIHLAYDLRPPAGAAGRAGLRTFGTWADTVAYALELHGRPAEPEATVAAKAAGLCADATTRWERIEALATHAQQLRYVAILMNAGSGGGYTPHAAATVLRCGYGDCKDKTTLLRALLATQGIRAWPVLCYSGDATAVRDDWPSPIQFNHVLAAIELGDAEAPESPFIIDHPGTGRVLLFDPTDPYTRIGDFPQPNQGGSVLVCAPGSAQLTRVPVAPPEFNHHRRRAKVAVTPGGAANVGTYELFTGAEAAGARFRYPHPDSLQETVEKQLLEVHPAVQLSRTELGTTQVPGQVTLRTWFVAPRFCRAVRDQMLLLPPVLRLDERSAPLPDQPRAGPVLLPTVSVNESTEFLLPEGFRVSEVNEPVTLERDFGAFVLSLKPEEGRIVSRRSLVLRGGVLPASSYPEVREFFETMRKVETTPVVLERTAP